MSREELVELAFRFGHVGELDADLVLDLLFANHESRLFRVALDEKQDVYLLASWPRARLDDERIAWLIEEFGRACADLAEDLADVL